MVVIRKTWKTPRLVLGLMAFEFCATVAILALFGIAAPDLFRTKLWKEGGRLGFNSDPNEILYAYANYRPIPKIPLVWSQFLTNWNIVISVLSMFLMLVKGVLYVMHVFYPLLSLFLHAGLAAIYAVSIYGQAGPDKSNPEHPSSVAWYLTKSCDVVFDKRNVHYCEMAKGTFAVSVIMLAIFAFHIPLAIYSLIPGKGGHELEDESDYTMSKVPRDSMYSPKVQEFPPPPKTPFTPRTLAFNKLTSSLPGRGNGKV
ncbi:MAG: hypothetical protein M1832_001713 [Thelocarpon impressellum]|nr:MAG: hypothetical protein M1832_001713 [Thelocarpon impressellum]